MTITLAELAEIIGARLVGDGTRAVSACAPIDAAGPEDVAFVANPKYLQFVEETSAAAVICAAAVDTPAGPARLEADDPYFAFRNAMIALHGFREHPGALDDPGGRRSPNAFVHPRASVGEETIIHPGAVVEIDARVGPRSVLYPGVYVGPRAEIGADCILYPGAVVYDRCRLGDRVTVHANSTIGVDGFGYATHGGEHHKIPHDGIVVIEDEVEIGAGCSIERAAMGETRIGRGTKLDQLVVIGHGTTVGRYCLLVAHVGIAGSVKVGNYVVLGGQVGVAGHLTIGDGVQAAGKTAIIQDIEPGLKVGGTPAQPIDQAKRNALAGLDLYGLVKRVKKLERELAQMRAVSGVGDDPER